MSRQKIPQRLRDLVSDRAKYCCEYCYAQSKYSGPFSIEHIIPIAKGGNDEFDNLALACQHCNNYKYTKTHALDPITQVSVPLYSPRQHKWTEHFAWNEDYSKIIGITSLGRATVLSLKLNRTESVNLRQVLFRLKVHPPHS